MGRVGERFVLVRELGVGGMSRVFLGRDEVLDRPVAVKVLHPDLDDEETGARFRREGRTAAKLSHPNIVQVYDAGEDMMEGREVSYIVMEYVSGGDLKALMDRRGALPETMLVRLGADIAAALAHAHERGVIHRDVKPQNVLLDERGNPKLADFGIARALDTTHESRVGSYLGTAAYSSPEQLRGEKVTPKADVYGLGTTLYHAVVGEPPFTGAPIEVANQQILKKPAPPRERGARIGAGLERLILGCLEKHPDERPDTGRVYDKLVERVGARGATSPVDLDRNRKAAGPSGVSRAVGGAKAAGLSGLAAVRGKLEGMGSRRVEGPPDETISFPTRTFRSGSRQRIVMAAVLGALLLLLLTGAGIWALLASGDGTNAASNPGGNGQGQAAAGNGAEERRQADQREQPPGGAAENVSNDDPPENADQADAGPTLPLEQAEQTVFDMYYEMSFATPETSWVFLSSRLQDEIGSQQAWAEQEDIYSFTYMEFVSPPQASASGATARVRFEVRLDRTTGSELLSGTWVCVNEAGEWKLDRLEDEQRTPV